MLGAHGQPDTALLLDFALRAGVPEPVVLAGPVADAAAPAVPAVVDATADRWETEGTVS